MPGGLDGLHSKQTAWPQRYTVLCINEWSNDQLDRLSQTVCKRRSLTCRRVVLHDRYRQPVECITYYKLVGRLFSFFLRLRTAFADGVVASCFTSPAGKLNVDLVQKSVLASALAYSLRRWYTYAYIFGTIFFLYCLWWLFLWTLKVVNSPAENEAQPSNGTVPPTITAHPQAGTWRWK